MKALSPAATKQLTNGIRVLLGLLFIYSSVGKIADPAAFAAIVTNYQLFPPALVTAIAVVFPWIEALCGLALVVGRYEKGAALLVCLMMVVFTGVSLYNAHRGLNVACGCFSLSAREPSNVTLNALRNLAIMSAGAWVLFRPAPQAAAAAVHRRRDL